MAAYVRTISVVKKTNQQFPIKYNSIIFCNEFSPKLFQQNNNCNNNNNKKQCNCYSTNAFTNLLNTTKESTKNLIKDAVKHQYETSKKNVIKMNKNNFVRHQNRRNSVAHPQRTTSEIAQTFDSTAESLATKGFLRPHKPYTPPNDAREKINAILKVVNYSKPSDMAINDSKEKYEIFNLCFKTFQHGIPNSQLHEVNTIDQLIKFYELPVNTTIPYDAMKTMKLPENLHIQYEYLRFHPDTDEKFNGKSAFPKSSTIISSLKTREKYRGFTAKRSWP